MQRRYGGILGLLLLWTLPVWGQTVTPLATFPEFQATVAVTTENTVVLLDIDANSVAEDYPEVCLHNDGSASVTYDFDGVAVASATGRATIATGEAVCFNRGNFSRKYQAVGLITSSGTASVRVRAMR